MKKAIVALTILLLVLFIVGCENSVNPIQPQTQSSNAGASLAKKGGVSVNDGCTTIQSGELVASDGSVIESGYDKWGYNYQAHMFNGYYCDAYRNAEWCQPYKLDKLSMTLGFQIKIVMVMDY